MFGLFKKDNSKYVDNFKYTIYDLPLQVRVTKRGKTLVFEKSRYKNDDNNSHELNMDILNHICEEFHSSVRTLIYPCVAGILNNMPNFHEDKDNSLDMIFSFKSENGEQELYQVDLNPNTRENYMPISNKCIINNNLNKE